MTHREFVVQMIQAHSAQLSTGRSFDGQCDWTDGEDRCDATAHVVVLLVDRIEGRPMILTLCTACAKAIEAAYQEFAV